MDVKNAVSTGIFSSGWVGFDKYLVEEKIPEVGSWVTKRPVCLELFRFSHQKFYILGKFSVTGKLGWLVTLLAVFHAKHKPFRRRSISDDGVPCQHSQVR